MHKTRKVEQTTLPKDSQLWDKVGTSDFLDCFVTPAKMGPRRAAEIITDFPFWARILLKVRGVITAPFGLSGDGPEVANKVGPFPVELETQDELIAGFNDKHLDFRVSVFTKDDQVRLATWVHVHNWGGASLPSGNYALPHIDREKCNATGRIACTFGRYLRPLRCIDALMH